MPTTIVRPSGQVDVSRKSSSGCGPKSQSKKKKSQQPKSHGNGKERLKSPRSMAPPPVSGPWGKPKVVADSAPPPGFASSPSKSIVTGFSDEHVRLLRHRTLFAFRFLVGKAVKLQLVASNEQYAGILDCVDPDDFSIVLKNTKRLSSGADAKSFVDGSTVIFGRHQLAHLVADGAVNYRDVVFTSRISSGFRTDKEISGRNEEHLFGRELETASSWLDPVLDTGALEDSAPNDRHHSKNQNKGGWNQFEANEKLFGIVSTYDENIYTTRLDRSKISTEQSRAAEKLAQEIEQQSAAGNFHLQEERGQTGCGRKHSNDLDEEARYSSVDRRAPASSDKNTYVPPALRKAQRQSSADKSHAKTTEILSAIAPTGATTLSLPAPELTPAAILTANASLASKPLSFSEAVTGRSAVAATPEVAPQSALEGEPEEVEEATSLQIATASANGKDSRPAFAKSKGSSLKKKDAASEKEKRIESKAENKTDSKAENMTDSKLSSSSPLATTKLAKGESPIKKGLNPNAKEFKLSASAAEYMPSFAGVKEQVSPPYCGSSPVHMPYPHPGMVYPPPMQEEWMYDGAMGGEEGGEIGMPIYMQGGYAVSMGPNGAPIVYPPMMLQQNMRMMGGQRGNYGGYQQQGYNPRGCYLPPNGGHLGLPYIGDPCMSGGVGPQPPLPPTPSGDESPSEYFADVALTPPARSTTPKVKSVPGSSKQMALASKKQ